MSKHSNILKGITHDSAATPTSGDNEQTALSLSRRGEVNNSNFDYTLKIGRSGETNHMDDHYDVIERVDTTNLAAGSSPFYYTTGVVLGNQNFLSSTIIIYGAAGVTVTVTLEVTNDDAASPDWFGATNGVYCVWSDSATYKDTTGNDSFTVTNGTIKLTLSADDFRWGKYRWKVEVSGAGDNAVQIHDKLTAV